MILNTGLKFGLSIYHIDMTAKQLEVYDASSLILTVLLPEDTKHSSQKPTSSVSTSDNLKGSGGQRAVVFQTPSERTEKFLQPFESCGTSVST